MLLAIYVIYLFLMRKKHLHIISELDYFYSNRRYIVISVKLKAVLKVFVESTKS